MNERRQNDEGKVTLPDPAHLPAGYKIAGKYEIKKLLGMGGNGAVYEGEHTEIGHRVAIKVVHADLTDREDIIARFRREARICATIRNRHVGQVYDVGELPGGAPYMVMELQEGGSLASMLDRAPITIAAAVEIARQLLTGLQAAHDIGVIHRDVKPDNVMIVREPGAQLLVKLVDFGIGKNMNADLSSRGVTLQGMVVGSPDYMPPEQLRGEAIDQRVDVYATGVLLYEAVTGRVPFDAKSLTELFAAILRDPIAPPRVLRPECPPQLEQLIMRALARDANARYPTAAAMREALAHVQKTTGMEPHLLDEVARPGVRESSRSQLRPIVEAERTVTFDLAPTVGYRRDRRRLGWLVAGALGVSAVAAGLVYRLALPSGETRRAEVDPRRAEVYVVRPAPVAEQPGRPPPGPALPAPAASVQPGSQDGEPSGGGDQGELGQAAPDSIRETPAMASPPRGRARSSGGPLEPSLRPKPALRDAETRLPAAATGELLREAFAAFVRGQMPRAHALYREASMRAPDNPEAWRGLGMVSSRIGARDEAARAFKRYLALRPNASDAAAIRKRLDEL